MVDRVNWMVTLSTGYFENILANGTAVRRENSRWVDQRISSSPFDVSFQTLLIIRLCTSNRRAGVNTLTARPDAPRFDRDMRFAWSSWLHANFREFSRGLTPDPITFRAARNGGGSRRRGLSLNHAATSPSLSWSIHEPESHPSRPASSLRLYRRAQWPRDHQKHRDENN